MNPVEFCQDIFVGLFVTFYSRISCIIFKLQKVSSNYINAITCVYPYMINLLLFVLLLLQCCKCWFIGYNGCTHSFLHTSYCYYCYYLT